MKATYILLTILLFSCISDTSEAKKQIEANSIMTLLYNYESTKLPPPSLEEIKKRRIRPIKIDGEQIDSVKYAILEKCDWYDLSRVTIEMVPKEFRDLYSNYLEKKGRCFVDDFRIKDNKGAKVPFVPSDFSREGLERAKEQHNVLGIVFYSPIIFSSDGNKALICFGATREGLDSHLSVFYLEKIDGEWNIHSSRMLVIS